MAMNTGSKPSLAPIQPGPWKNDVSRPKNGSQACLSLFAEGDWSATIASSFTWPTLRDEVLDDVLRGTMVAPKRLRMSRTHRSANARRDRLVRGDERRAKPPRALEQQPLPVAVVRGEQQHATAAGQCLANDGLVLEAQPRLELPGRDARAVQDLRDQPAEQA